VTCPFLLRRRPAVADTLGDLSRAPLERVRDGASQLAARVREDDGPAQFARFVLVGVTSTVVYAALFVVLQRFGYLPAHLAATVASSILANEMHRRLTFRAEDRVSWFSAQWEAGGVTVIGLVATSTALRWLDSVAHTAPPIVQVGVVATVTAAIGVMRFIALRWIFRPQAAAAA